MEKVKAKVWLHSGAGKVNPFVNDTAKSAFLRPFVLKYMATEGIQAELEASSNTFQLYESGFDPRFVHSGHPLTALLWSGYSDSEYRYLTAQDEQAGFWFVPMQQALPSLMYFLGRANVPYTPRITTMWHSKYLTNYINALNNTLRSETWLVNHLKHYKKEIVIGLWLSYDGMENHHSWVLNLVRLIRHVLHESNLSLMYRFLLFTNAGDTLSNDELEQVGDYVDTTTNFLTFIGRVDKYISLDYCPTSFDPIAVMLAEDKTLLGKEVITAPRMDMLGLDYTFLPNEILSCLRALMSKGNPGLKAIVDAAAPAILSMLNVVTKES